MTNEANTMTCQQFQARLPELIGSGEKLDNHPHLRQCALCRALLADLETIAEAAYGPRSNPPSRKRMPRCHRRPNWSDFTV